jgi:hypothetical protein
MNFFKSYILILGFTTLFAACNTDEPNFDGNLTSEQIAALVSEANTKLFAENEISVFYIEENYNGMMHKFERKLELNLSTKKSLDIKKVVGVYVDFDYYDETTHYRFMGATEQEPVDNFTSEKISTGYWKYYMLDLPYLSESLGKWKEKDGKFVVDYPYNPNLNDEMYEGSKYYLTLSENNEYLKIELKSATDESMATYDFSYTANPTFPSGYQISQFPAAKQYGTKVNWGETYGTDTYYTSLDMSDSVKYFCITEYEATPKIAGKTPLFYYDAAHTQLILESHAKTGFSTTYFYYEDIYYWSFAALLTSEIDGITVYVHWEDAETVNNLYGSD